MSNKYKCKYSQCATLSGPAILLFSKELCTVNSGYNEHYGTFKRYLLYPEFVVKENIINHEKGSGYKNVITRNRNNQVRYKHSLLYIQ